MHNPWKGRTHLWQTSPSPPADRCDLAFVRVQSHVLYALLVDGAPGRASARPPWPRETLFDAVGTVFLDYAEPEAMLRELGARLRSTFHGQTWRFSAAATAIRWDAATGLLTVAEAGDTKAWLVNRPAALPLTDGGIPQPGIALRNMLGDVAPEIRTKEVRLAVDGGPDGPSVAILTDGAYAILRSPNGTLPTDTNAWAIDAVGLDDATVLLIQAPQ